MSRSISLVGALALLNLAVPALSQQPNGAPAAQSSAAPAKDSTKATTLHLAEPADFPAAARQALGQRMNQHADQLEWLLSAALMLNYDLADKSAMNLANDPKLAPPPPGELDTLNAALPKRFFALQAQLSKKALAVAAAARAHDDKKLAKAVGSLTETCVACHAVYLYGKGKAAGDSGN